ncbi:MAG: DNA helicase II [Pseudohongiellaceae bacterium]
MSHMDVSYILDSLNEEQRRAVCSGSKSLLVLAGAGSGKTRVLVHRIAWLIQKERVSPSEILAVTFTNKAAREMRNRIEEMLGQTFTNMWMGTFHGLAHRLLRYHWKEAGLPQDFVILDADDQLRLIRRLLRDLQISEPKPKQCQSWINEQKDKGLRAQHIKEPGNEESDSEDISSLLRLYRAYEEECKRRGMVDFGEILLCAHDLWLRSPQLLANYQDRFKHILVDEFQDTNTIQYGWLRMLAGSTNASNAAYSSIMAVGDDDQSIYGWRGARIENIQDFRKHFPNTEFIRLEQNYRSTKTILDAANGLIAHNHKRLGKKLWTEGDKGESINIYTAINGKDEARFIVDRIQNWVNGNNKLEEVAILYRANAQSRELEEALMQVNMPYRIYGGLRFYERLEVKNVLAYLRLLANRHDDTALRRVINVPARKIGERTIRKLITVARASDCSLWQAAITAVNEDHLAGRAANAVFNFLKLIDGMQDACTSQPLHNKTDYVIEHSGLLEHHKKEGGEEAESRLENLRALVNAAYYFDGGDLLAEAGNNIDNTSMEYLAAFLNQAALNAGEAPASEVQDNEYIGEVQLMTLHSAKGLEFDLVFLAGMEDGLFPHKRSIGDSNGLEEERRLCYVGITRAKQKLYLSHAETSRLHGDTIYPERSRFIHEIPAELIKKDHHGGSFMRVTKPSQIDQSQFSNLDTTVSVPETDLSLGQRVTHKKFGEGVIMNCEGQGSGARVQVNFNEAGSKWLVLSLANLEAL